MRRQQFTEAQVTALLDPPTDQRELVRHSTLSAADLAAIRRCRGDHNRLGHALMLCYLRYPGRPLKADERPPRPLLLFIAEQIDALPESIEDYLAAERNRQRHVAELQDRLGFRPFGTRPAADLAGWLLPHAIEKRPACASCRACGGGVPAAPDRRPIARRARAALRPSPLSGAWQGPTPADRWALRRPTSSAGCADAAPGGNQPELARLATPDAGSGEAGRDARSDRAIGPCPRSWP